MCSVVCTFQPASRGDSLAWDSDSLSLKPCCFSAVLSRTRNGSAGTNLCLARQSLSQPGLTIRQPRAMQHRNLTVRRTLSVIKCVQSKTESAREPPSSHTVREPASSISPVNMIQGLDWDGAVEEGLGRGEFTVADALPVFTSPLVPEIANNQYYMFTSLMKAAKIACIIILPNLPQYMHVHMYIIWLILWLFLNQSK